jgi:hypothetical protein
LSGSVAHLVGIQVAVAAVLCCSEAYLNESTTTYVTIFFNSEIHRDGVKLQTFFQFISGELRSPWP